MVDELDATIAGEKPQTYCTQYSNGLLTDTKFLSRPSLSCPQQVRQLRDYSCIMQRQSAWMGAKRDIFYAEGQQRLLEV